MSKRIGIVIPVYNQHPQYVEQAILSCVNQICPKEIEIKIVVVDDGSTNNWYDKISIPNNVILIKLDKNMGAPYALNYGAKQLDSDYFTFVPSDDYLFQDKLYTQLEYMLAEKLEYSWTGYREHWYDDFGTLLAIVDRAGITLDYSTPLSIFSSLTKKDYGNNFINGGSILMPLALFHSIGGYDESLIYQPDYDLSLKITNKVKSNGVPYCMMVRRNHNNQTKHLCANDPSKEERLCRHKEYVKIKLKWQDSIYPITKEGIDINLIKQLGY